jgi:hypothetical protein
VKVIATPVYYAVRRKETRLAGSAWVLGHVEDRTGRRAVRARKMKTGHKEKEK